MTQDKNISSLAVAVGVALMALASYHLLSHPELEMKPWLQFVLKSVLFTCLVVSWPANVEFAQGCNFLTSTYSPLLCRPLWDLCLALGI
jgi:membrane-associated HD superfamily phosphohydrolase